MGPKEIQEFIINIIKHLFKNLFNSYIWNKKLIFAVPAVTTGDKSEQFSISFYDKNSTKNKLMYTFLYVYCLMFYSTD